MIWLTMFWILVLAVTALCAPVTKDPMFIPDNHAENAIHLQNIQVATSYFVNYKAKIIRAKLNKNNVDKMFGLVFGFNLTGETVIWKNDQSENRIQGHLTFFQKLNNIGFTSTKEAINGHEDKEKRNSKSYKGKTSSYGLGKQRIKKETKGVFKKTSEVKDAEKDTQVLDVDLALEPDSQVVRYGDGFLSLQDVYEKKGGICTLIHGYKNVPIYVISSCRTLTGPSNIREMCEHPTGDRRFADDVAIDIVWTPVQDEEGFVYRNVYCAQCNGKENVQAWFTKLDCDDFEPLSFSDGLDRLVLLGTTAGSSHNCITEIFPAINKRIHECLDAEYIIDTPGPMHQTRLGEQSTQQSPFPLSFSIFMNFGFDGKTHILFSTNGDKVLGSEACGDNEIYDSQNSKCRAIFCNPGYRLVDRVCTKDANINNPEDITDLNGIDDMVQVNLTIRNVTYDDLLLLCLTGSEIGLSSELSRQLNISLERIQNLTINVINTTDGPSSTYMEIHYYAIPFLQKEKERVKTTDSSKLFSNKTNGHQYDDITFTHSGIESHETNSKLIADVYDENPDYYYLSPDIGKGNETMKMKAMNRVVDLNDTLSNTSQDRNGYLNTSEMLNNDTDTWLHKQLNISILISFILLPAPERKDISENEKSVGNVLQYINYLASSSSFSITLNGTHLLVDNVLRAPNPSSMDDFCKYGNPVYVDSDGFVLETLTKKGTTINVVYVNETAQRYFPKQYDLTLMVDGIVGNLKDANESGFAFVCNMPKIADEKCTTIVLNSPEYTYFKNKTIMFADRVYSFNEYEYISENNGTIKVCAPETWRKQMEEEPLRVCGEDMKKIEIAESYLTYILGVISLIAMFIVLVTYSIFEKLRNLPGVNTFNLTLSLFLGELVFLISGWIQPQQEWLCTAVGMLLHYLFLTSFFWMNVISYDVYKTFARTCILRRIRDKKKYAPLYSLYAWGAPLIIVSICAFLDYSNLFEGVDVGYGSAPTSWKDGDFAAGFNETTAVARVRNDQGCWIQQPEASLIAFGGPLLLIILINGVMFTRTIICIRASTVMTRKSLSRSSVRHMTGHDDVMLYVRMSTVMGFTWIFGLASSAGSAFVQNAGNLECIVLHVLQILFIVFNCSVGLFIFFAFVVNRRVFALYRGLITNYRCSRKRNLSTTSRTTLVSQLSESSVSVISIKYRESV